LPLRKEKILIMKQIAIVHGSRPVPHDCFECVAPAFRLYRQRNAAAARIHPRTLRVSSGHLGHCFQFEATVDDHPTAFNAALNDPFPPLVIGTAPWYRSVL
jgi:hypothetical protein